MIELPLIFVAGFLGSSHCIGMCGPFALLLGASSRRSWRSAVGRQLTYSAGRLFTYCSLGALAGFCGWRFSATAQQLINVPACLAIMAGLFLVYQGLRTAGVLRWPVVKGESAGCLAGGLLANFLKSSARTDVFLAGLFTGFLPCGLVYGFVGLAASTRDITTGSLVMAAFGLGTVPIMVATGCGGQLLSTASRGRLFRIAAWCIVLAGALSIARGASFLGVVGDDAAVSESCPLCP